MAERKLRKLSGESLRLREKHRRRVNITSILQHHTTRRFNTRWRPQHARIPLLLNVNQEYAKEYPKRKRKWKVFSREIHILPVTLFRNYISCKSNYLQK